MTTKKKKKTKHISDPFITIQKEDGMDVLVYTGDIKETEFFLSGRLYHIGLSDGTLLKYDQTKHEKLFLVKKGTSLIKYVEDNEVYANYVTVKEDGIDWIVCGELDEF